MKKFNTWGTCNPARHYMVRLENTLEKILCNVEEGRYLIMSRPRQYGKSTMLAAVKRELVVRYIVVRMSLKELDEAFETRKGFSLAFCGRILDMAKDDEYLLIPEQTAETMRSVAQGKTTANLQRLMSIIRDWCRESPKPVILIMDEVDQAEGSEVFRDFLGKLWEEYIRRNDEGTPALRSVILAGVTDVEHLKSGIRSEGESRGQGSPWNIADNIAFPMELPADGIAGMLSEYVADHQMDMDIPAVVQTIMKWTSGYPYLVSRICQILDEEIEEKMGKDPDEVWTASGVDEAANRIIISRNDLLSSLMRKVDSDPVLAKKLSDFIYQGRYIHYNIDNQAQQSFLLYGFARVKGSNLVISNEIFRTRLTRKFDDDYIEGHSNIKDAFDTGTKYSKYAMTDGTLDVYHILSDFIRVFSRIRSSMKAEGNEEERKFVEDDGRRMFLLFLAPIINGTGTYSIEEQTLDNRRMDLVIHYLGRRYIIELKIWHGAKYNADGERQLSDYLEYFGLDVGYMLSFSFNKNKHTGMETHTVGNRVLHEAIV